MIEFPVDPTEDLPYAYGGAPLKGLLKDQAEDFQVDEILGYEATGEGDHVFLNIKKRGLNTLEVARLIQEHAGVKQVDIGFAGLKDKHAITTQAFSVHIPGKEGPDWKLLNSDNLEILNAQRHNRKIRRGSLRGNSFVIRLKNTEGDKSLTEEMLTAIAAQGVPNYFGQQRFGREASNLYRAELFFKKELRKPQRNQIGIMLSAARSYLFNKVVAARVKQGTWNKALLGDVMLLEGSNRQFLVKSLDDDIQQRVETFDVHPSGAMPGGRGRAVNTEDQAADLENTVLSDDLSKSWIKGLGKNRIDADRRSLRLVPESMEHEWQDDDLVLSFSLNSGSYATSLLREFLKNES